MEKSEFDSLIGITTDPECYARIQDVYVECDAIRSKRQIAKIYDRYDMNGIETIYRTITGSGTIEDIEFTAQILRSTM